MNKINCCVVLTTTDSKQNAELIAEMLIKLKLAACVQMDKVESMFFYEGQTQKSEEYRLMIKAASDNYKAIEDVIVKEHSYKLPQVIKLDITGGLSEYIEWIHHG